MIDIEQISSGLEQKKDGIWYSIIDNKNISYPLNGNQTCFDIEERSFWFKHRNNCIISVVELYPPKNNEAIFDIGGGNGFVTQALIKSGFNTVLLEPNKSGVLNAKKRGLAPIICSAIENAEFKQHSLAAVGLFDVLEHIEDDLSFLKSMRSLVKKNGYIYMTVPAYPFLWSEEDILAGHFRRYTLNNIHKLLSSVGFKVEFSSYIFQYLPIPITFFRVLPYQMGLLNYKYKPHKVARTHVQKDIIMKLLNSILNLEVENLKKLKKMTFGGSCLVVAKNIYERFG